MSCARSCAQSNQAAKQSKALDDGVNQALILDLEPREWNNMDSGGKLP